MHSLRLKVAVVGAGLGGLAAAIGIAKAGHQVIVIEQASALSEVLQQYLNAIGIG